eukprot:m.149400 g.149400  ORF g.149400 m.149400 type:complete len:62 (+) comp17346_c1_seq2:1020-1205(+)
MTTFFLNTVRRTQLASVSKEGRAFVWMQLTARIFDDRSVSTSTLSLAGITSSFGFYKGGDG